MEAPDSTSVHRVSQNPQAQTRPQEISTDSSYPTSVAGSSSSYQPSTPNTSTSSSFSLPRPVGRANSLSNVSPMEAAGIIATLKDKSVDELRKILTDKDAYQNLLLSLEPVKTQNRVRDELKNSTLQLARENLEKEPRIMELRNQCRIIRTTELATAQEKLQELERMKEEILKNYSPSSLLHRLQEATKHIDEESEMLHKQLLEREIDPSAFVQKYKKLRHDYHRRESIHSAAKASASS